MTAPPPGELPDQPASEAAADDACLADVTEEEAAAAAAELPPITEEPSDADVAINLGEEPPDPVEDGPP